MAGGTVESSHEICEANLRLHGEILIMEPLKMSDVLLYQQLSPMAYLGNIAGNASFGKFGGSSGREQRYDRIMYYFCESPLTFCNADSFESAILESIDRNDTDLKLWKTKGISPSEFGGVEMHTIYRLSSERHHAHFDFDMFPTQHGLNIHALIVMVQPEFQGGFFHLRDFLINRVAKTLFDCRNHKVAMLTGRAVQNQFGIRQKREWRNQKVKGGSTTKIIRLYERLGFVREKPDSSMVILLSDQTRHDFLSSRNPAERLLAEQQGKMARAKKPVCQVSKSVLAAN